ncbi:MAG: hypothetical protein ACK4NF_03255 [Planctomycetota bacterium]
MNVLFSLSIVIVSLFSHTFFVSKFYIDISLILLVLLTSYLPFYCAIIFASIIDLENIVISGTNIPFYLIMLLILIFLDKFVVIKNNLIKIGYMSWLYLPVSVSISYLYNSLNRDYIVSVFFMTMSCLIIISLIVDMIVGVVKKIL